MIILICLAILSPVLVLSPLPFIQAQQSAQQDGPLKLMTNLVEIRAVVTDRDGRVVDHLKKEDFEVLESGRQQQLDFFALERLPSRPGTTETPPRTEGDLKPPTSAYRPKRTILLFVDTLHLSNESLLRAKQALRRLIGEIGEEDLVAVVSSGGPMGVFNQFTRDRRILLYAVEGLTVWGISSSKFRPHLAYLVSNDSNPGDTRGPTSAAIEIVRAEEGGSGLGNARATQRDIQLRARSILSEAARWRGASLRTLEAAMGLMAATPGQRVVFYISDGFTLEDVAGNAHGELNRVTSRAVRSGILVYSIDAKGLETDSPINDASSRVVITPDIYRYVSDSYKEEQDGINALGKDTGGDAFFNNNDIGDLIRRALDANSVYYALAYYMPAEKNDTGYRRLSVRIKNHPEYHVRAQKGYLPPDPKREVELAKQGPQQTLMKAIAAPLPQTMIGVTAAAYYLERDADNAQVSVGVFIDGKTLDYRSQESVQLIDCEVTTAILDMTGKTSQVMTDNIKATLTPEQLEDGKRDGYRYMKRLALKPGIYDIRVGVRENGSERIGTASAWVEVPNLARAKLAASSIVLTTVRPAVAGTPRTEGPGLMPPGIRQGIAYFKQGASLAYYMTVYESSARKPEESGLLIQSEVVREGRSMYRSDWRPISERVIELGSKGFDVGGRINLDFQPGTYELHVTVKDPKSNRLAQRDVIFEVDR